MSKTIAKSPSGLSTVVYRPRGRTLSERRQELSEVSKRYRTLVALKKRETA